jgi:hypothetical protein
MLYNSCTGIYNFGNNTYPWRIRSRSNLCHIFREKCASYGPGNTVLSVCYGHQYVPVTLVTIFMVIILRINSSLDFTSLHYTSLPIFHFPTLSDVSLSFLFFFRRRNNPSRPRRPHYQGFTITHRHNTFGRTPLDEWSARNTDLYLTTHNIHNRETSVLLADANPQSQKASGRTPKP